MRKLPERTGMFVVSTLFAACSLLLSSPTKAGNEHEALVLICPRDDLARCTIASARIFFKVRVESAVPSGCLALAMAKAAEVADLVGKEEAPKISCGR